MNASERAADLERCPTKYVCTKAVNTKIGLPILGRTYDLGARQLHS